MNIQLILAIVIILIIIVSVIYWAYKKEKMASWSEYAKIGSGLNTNVKNVESSMDTLNRLENIN